ncbi:MAG: chromosome segregation protein SMC, partial [Evtepia sp.]
MYLKALDILGFKSFPDPITLTFHDNITAIVGPNGSGKSNIADALRWVMGEQSSRALRGGKMEDVIFTGTEARRKQGFAQVSITMSNEDGRFPVDESELVVTRRYHRSGDSEYEINRRPVRLRDVTELFMDTGLGQEGYAHIGQGKIDEILSVKSTQRREIFEEAAGISRYRHRKEEAERKLSHTEDNLLRIRDKLDELERQVAPLKKQSEEAHTYLICREELRTLEISIWMKQLQKVREQKQDLEERRDQVAQQLDETKNEVERLYETLENLTHRLRGKEAETEEIRAEASQLEIEKGNCEQNLSALHERKMNNEENAVQLRSELELQEIRAKEAKEQLEQKQKKLETLQIELPEVKQFLRALNEIKQKSETVRVAMTACEKESERETRAEQDVRAEMSARTATIQEILEKQSRLTQSLKVLSSEDNRRKERHTAMQSERDSLLLGKDELEARLRQVRRELELYRRDEKEQESQSVKRRMEEHADTARIQMLSEMEKFYDGYSKAVKTVMQEKTIPGIHGPVAALVRVPEPYTVALEIALGGAMQYIVTETEQNSKAVLQFLKRRDAGRATCLPLATIRPNTLRETGLDQIEGFVGLACDLIEFDVRYTPIVQNLLGRVVIARDLDSATQLARRFQYRFRIVTLDGQVVNQGGSLTGGSVNRSVGIFSRAKELAHLTALQPARNTARLDADEKLQTSRQRTAEAIRRIEQIQEEKRKLEDRILMLDGQLDSLLTHQKNAEEQRQQEENEAVKLDTRHSELERQVKGLKSEQVGHKERIECLTTQHAALLSQMRTWTLAEENEEEKIREVRVRQAELATEKRLSEQALEEQRKTMETLSADCAKQEGRIRQLDIQNTALEREEAQANLHLEALKREQDAMNQKLVGQSQKKLDLEAARNQADRDSRAQNETLLTLQRSTADLEHKALAARLEEEQLLNKMWETYEVTHEGARLIEVEVTAETDRRVAALREQLRKIGQVNLGAIEAFSQVNERYTYLKDQQADVETSQKKLLELIG